jgi:hypothetical protein
VTTSKPRLVTRLDDETDFRLRMTAVVEARPLTEVLKDALNKGLRTRDQLAELVRTGGAADDIAS